LKDVSRTRERQQRQTEERRCSCSQVPCRNTESLTRPNFSMKTRSSFVQQPYVRVSFLYVPVVFIANVPIAITYPKSHPGAVPRRQTAHHSCDNGRTVSELLPRVAETGCVTAMTNTQCRAHVCRAFSRSHKHLRQPSAAPCCWLGELCGAWLCRRMETNRDVNLICISRAKLNRTPSAHSNTLRCF